MGPVDGSGRTRRSGAVLEGLELDLYWGVALDVSSSRSFHERCDCASLREWCKFEVTEFATEAVAEVHVGIPKIVSRYEKSLHRYTPARSVYQIHTPRSQESSLIGESHGGAPPSGRGVKILCMKSEEFSNYSIVMSSKFNFFVPAERNCGARRAARLIASFGPIRPYYAPLERT